VDAPGHEPKSPITVLAGALVVSVDAQRRIFPDGAVAFDGDGWIVATGPTGAVLQEIDGRSDPGPCEVHTVDCRRQVLVPGFVDAHVHLGEHLLRGLVPDGAGPTEWLPNWLLPAYAALTPGDERLAAELAMAEMLLGGTTTVGEAGTLLEWEPVAEAADDWGIRAQLGRWTWDLPDRPARMAQTTSSALRSAHQLLDGVGALGKPLLSRAVTLLGLETCSPDLMREAAALAGAYGVPLVTMHASVAPEHGGLPMSAHRLEELGWLTAHTKLVHAVYVTTRDIEMMAGSGVSVVHCPTAGLRHAKGIGRHGRFADMLAAGMAVGLGGDSANGSNHLRMTDLMWLASALPKDAKMACDVGAPEEALEMATRHGARCLGQEQLIGSLEVGKQADVVAFSTDHPEWHPPLHPIQNLVLASGARSIVSVWVAGKQLVRDGALVGHDMTELLDRADAASAALVERSGLSVPWRWPVTVDGGQRPS